MPLRLCYSLRCRRRRRLTRRHGVGVHGLSFFIVASGGVELHSDLVLDHFVTKTSFSGNSDWRRVSEA